ncbi:hypothetical protein J6590_072380 [Homalodisca vitripennis]|nr:hypothetical protein J6590_072380 [Homalodisca vitripennis]
MKRKETQAKGTPDMSAAEMYSAEEELSYIKDALYQRGRKKERSGNADATRPLLLSEPFEGDLLAQREILYRVEVEPL